MEREEVNKKEEEVDKKEKEVDKKEGVVVEGKCNRDVLLEKEE